ncbi:hypothetical protein DMP07_04440 [Slackia faecicanis]|uniref:Uncharacterized protein n=1 Tax=Slackia faecicanis TaxID=255723 RepID=A0A3N0AG92_9ACTN|nr:hypothetical protein [Slackia faecicanis]RNL20832.1 hypothetical protein DMP07_04440 [Slackia faecicanis]
MKPTNEERREVAARLRVLSSHREVDKELVEDALGLYMGECIDGYDPVSVMELADLIEPEPERACCDEGTSAFRCGRCGAFALRDAITDLCGPIPIRYCPNCGAKVVER